MFGWIRSGEIFYQCKRLNCSPGSSYSDWTDEEARDLAADVVAAAIPKFKDRALVGGEWDPEKGASLSTYFIGMCVFQFSPFYRRWRSQKKTLSEIVTLAELPAESYPESVQSAEAVVMSKHEVRTALAGIGDERLRVVVLLHSLGYTYVEIGELIGSTAKAVDGMLNRHRNRLGKSGDGRGVPNG